MMIRKTLAALAIACAFGPASAALLTFDDESLQNNDGPTPSYMGFTLGSTGYLDRLDWLNTSSSGPFGLWNWGTVSGDFTVLNNYGGDGIVRAADGSDFTFDGVWARTVGERNPGRPGAFVGLNNGQVVWTQDAVLTETWTQFGGMSGAIDELRLNLGGYFLIDNLALNEGGTVPEPTSLLLAGLGLAALGRARRRCSQAKG